MEPTRRNKDKMNLVFIFVGAVILAAQKCLANDSQMIKSAATPDAYGSLLLLLSTTRPKRPLKNLRDLDLKPEKEICID